MDDAKPKLRAIQAIPYDSGGERLICLRDTSGLSKKTIILPLRTFYMVSLLDGAHTLREIQAEYARRFGDVLLIEKIEALVRQLDEALMLDGERASAARQAMAAEFAQTPTRKAAHAGAAYPTRPQGVVDLLQGFFRARGGPGEIDRSSEATELRGVMAPHIDFKRGGPDYAHAYKALAERCPAEIFVVLGVLHEPAGALFITTEKHFETPLGIVACDRAFTQELSRRAGLTKGPQELAHRSEHSIEFQAVMLRYVFGSLRPARIVPVLCGSIGESLPDGADPLTQPEVARFVQALRSLLAEYGERAAVIASVDLAHVGRQFGDDFDLGPELPARVEAEDRELLAFAERMDAPGFYAHNRAQQDRRHVCGIDAVTVMLASLPARRGHLLHYGQAASRETNSIVSFAAMAFEA
jgi:AmmeMemoRadiSam system protein B